MEEGLPSKLSSLSFKSLRPLQTSQDEVFPEHPVGVEYGVLGNGIHYYVRNNPKPRHRAALALGVRVGSVLEEEEERGVAHIVEHLAFSATKNYTNHDLVKFLESIGAEFGACQNASTSADETIYELLVPIDKPGLLSRAVSVLAEFTSEIRVSEEDLEKERGAVLDEYRSGRNATGRMQEAHWILMMEGSKYADRQPIGLEKVIRTVSANQVRDFYHRWYKPQHMAVVAVGDFSDTQSVVELIRSHFESKFSEMNSETNTSIPRYPVPEHDEPRFSCFTETEAGGSTVAVSCKIGNREFKTIGDYKNYLIESMFHMALSQRFFKISRCENPPFYSCGSAGEYLVHPVKAYIISSSCKEKGTLQALESMLTEVARIRLFGFSDREIALVRAFLLAEMESAYLEKDQIQSTSLRDEYLQHFLREEPVVGIEYEAQLQKTLLPQITAADVSKLADYYRTTCSCVIKIMEPRAYATIEDLRAIVNKVRALEESAGISPWDEEQIPDAIVEKIPEPGLVMSTKSFPEIGVTEMILSNGMQVCYKCTDFLDDQIVFTGFAYGGLSEVPEKEFLSCSMGSTIAGEIGIFGYRPYLLLDMLAGKRAEVATKISAYMRSFSGDCSPTDLETALQLVYQLFVTSVVPRDNEVKIVMQITKELIQAQERDPYTAFSNRVSQINYGNSYYFKPNTVKGLSKVDPKKSCQYFDECFKDPSRFTVVIVGKIDPETALPLILKYLGGIPKPEKEIMQYERDELKGLPFTFPKGVVREEVRRHMVEAQSSVQITFPVELGGSKVLEEVQIAGLIGKLLETKIMQLLRFKHGLIYSAAVYVFLGGSKPSRSGGVRGDITINCSCDPENTWNLVDLALDEVNHILEIGPSEEDVHTVLELEQRTYEIGQQENAYWLDRLLRAYQSRMYMGDLKVSFEVQDECRNSVRSTLTASTMKDALCRILPVPCNSQYTAVTLVPRVSRWQQFSTLLGDAENKFISDGKIALATIGAVVFTAVVWRYSRRL